MAKLDGNLQVSYVPRDSVVHYIPPITLGVCLVTLMFVLFLPIVFGNKNHIQNNPEPQKQPIKQETKLKKIVGIKELD